MSQQVYEISVKVSNDDVKLVEKSIHYDPGLILSHEDAELSRIVESAKSKFKGEIKQVVITIKYFWE